MINNSIDDLNNENTPINSINDSFSNNLTEDGVPKSMYFEMTLLNKFFILFQKNYFNFLKIILTKN